MSSIHIHNRCYGKVEKSLQEIQGNGGCYCPRCKQNVVNEDWTSCVPVAALCGIRKVKVTESNSGVIDMIIQFSEVEKNARKR